MNMCQDLSLCSRGSVGSASEGDERNEEQGLALPVGNFLIMTTDTIQNVKNSRALACVTSRRPE